MKICIIGCTGHVGYVFPGLENNSEDRIVGLAPGSAGEEAEKLLEPACKVGGAPEVFADFRRMLEKIRPEIAVVSPQYCDHAKVAAAALDAGCHVFVEKPAATTFADLALVREAHARAGTHLAPMLGLRHEPHFYTAWKMVRDGRIGEVRLITAQKSYRLGQRRDFFRKRETYGGTIPWVGSHSIDLISWFAGREFVSVFAGHSTMHNRDHGELELTALCHFALDDEVLASTNIDYLRPRTAATHGDDRVRVAGTRGVVEVRAGKAWLIEEDTEGEQELALEDPPQIFADFLRAVRGQDKPLLDARDALRVTDACLRARLAADEDRVVYFNEEMTS